MSKYVGMIRNRAMGGGVTSHSSHPLDPPLLYVLLDTK